MKSMRDRLAHVEIRQLVGLLILIAVSFALCNDISLLWRDLDGMLGLVLLLVPGMLSPRRWLPEAFVVTAIASGVFAGYWLALDVVGRAKSPTYWIGFMLVAVILAVCAKISNAIRTRLQSGG